MRFCLLSLLLAAGLCLSAQNTYAPLTQINNGQRWLRTPAAAAYSPGDRVLIYQHGGASIELSGPNVGSVNNLNGAGHYDLNRVSRTGGDTVFLALPLTHAYAVSCSQLITSPATEDLLVTTALTAPPYDGTTGGVLFLAADRAIEVDAPLSAAGTGFRGGQGQEADSDCNRFTVADDETYDPGNWRGSARGEGIAGVPGGQEAGRAPAANGGGGGNDHNTGGGGGTNVSGGGLGARNIVTGVFNNACRGNFPGRGGRANAAPPERLYFGGGGGAGHANNTTAARGGRGGGLIVLWAPTVRFLAGGSVDARGESPATVAGDGGGGGGGGGSLLIVATDLAGTPAIDLGGARGADVDNPSDRCFGPGGGGGGGRFVRAARNVDNWAPDIDVAAGGFGLRLNSGECGPTEEPGGSGSPGLVQNIDYPVPIPGLSQSADTVCADGGLLLVDESSGADAAELSLLPASEAVDLTPNEEGFDLTFDDTLNGEFLVVQTLFLDGQTYPGDTLRFTVFSVATAADAAIVYTEQTVTATLTNSTGFDSIRYDFGDGTVVDTNVTSLSHTYAAGGEYTTTVTLFNARCGNREAASASASLAEFAVADTDIKSATGCAPFTLRITDISTGAYRGGRWNFPGADPTLVFDETSPEVTFNEPGVFLGTLTLLGALGPDTVAPFTVIVNPTPTAEFDFGVDTATAVFTATTDLAEDFSWTFGDGAGVSTDQNPVYTYDSTGTFLVTLTASLGACSFTVSRNVVIDVLSDVRDLHRLGVRLFPNPTSGELRLTGRAELLDVFDQNGRYLGPLSGRSADLGRLPKGTYVVRVRAAGRVFSVRVLRR